MLNNRQIAVVAAVLSLTAACVGQSPKAARSATPPRRQAALRYFLQDYVGHAAPNGDRATHYVPAFVDLKDDGAQEAIVYLNGPESCGSGGCTLLVLVPEGSSYRVLTGVTIARPPIRVLETKSHGWHDISVHVQGGGIIRPYQAKLSFNGKTYPRNPTVPPARRVSGHVPGRVVVPVRGEGKPLFP